jgi:hypothetical protein
MIAASIVAGGSIFALAQAADPPKPAPVDAQETKKVEAVNSLSTASQLASFGRGELDSETGLKGFKSPEALVSAGGILLRANNAFGGKVEALDAKPTDEAGKAIDSKTEKVNSLSDEANALFDEARALVAGDKKKSAEIEALIKQAQKIDTLESRGAVGYPRALQGTLAPGANHWYKIPFVPGLPASVAMRSTGTSRLRFVVTGPGGNQLFSLVGPTAYYNWMVNRDNQPRMITITITNTGKNVAAYQLFTN